MIPGRRRDFRLPLSRGTVDREIEDELQFHLSMRIEEPVAQGMAPAQAREQAERELGGYAVARSQLSKLGHARVRRARRADVREVIGNDVHHALRMLIREPGLSFAVILTVAIGLGVNAVMFGITDRLLFRAPPGVHDAGDVSRVYFRASLEPSRMMHYPVTTWPQYENLRAQGLVADIGAASHPRKAPFGTGREARSVRVVLATGSFFTTLAARPSLGRFFTDDESRDGSAVAVISAPFWKHQFGGSPIDGLRIRVGTRDYDVVGVAEAGFTGADLEPVDVWLPIATAGTELGGSRWDTESLQWLRVLVRQREGEPRAATARALGIAARERDFIMGFDSASTVTLEPMAVGRMAGSARNPNAMSNGRIALWLSGVSAVVLLIACANVANLLLARAVRRRREIGVKLALGMGRGRMAAQLLTDALVLATLGALAALLFAHVTGSLARSVLLPDIEWAGRPLVDARLLVFAGIALLLTVLLSGLAPALYAVRENVVGALGLGVRAGVRRSRLRTALVVAQTALSVVLLASAAMFVSSLRNAHRIDLGIRAEDLIAVRWHEGSLTMQRAEREALYEEAVRRLQQLPQVRGVTRVAHAPFMSSTSVSVTGDGSTAPDDGFNAGMNAVAPGYLAVAGTPLLRGRDFNSNDVAGAETVTLVSESLARLLWPNAEPLGSCLRYRDDRPCMRVVGVIRGMRMPEPGAGEQPMFLVPIAQSTDLAGSAALLVRTGAGTNAVQEVVRAVRPELGHVEVMAYGQVLAPMVWPWLLGARLFTTFGLIALVLAAFGLYGIIAYDVTQRQGEMSVRMALGAQRTAVARLVLGDAGRMIAAGAVIGIVIALLTGPMLQALLFDVSGRDPRLLGAACAVLGLCGLSAAALPAWRASRADPMRAMKEA